MQEFRDKRRMGHAFGRCGFKLMSNESESAKKICAFGPFFLVILEAGASAFILAQIAV